MNPYLNTWVNDWLLNENLTQISLKFIKVSFAGPQGHSGVLSLNLKHIPQFIYIAGQQIILGGKGEILYTVHLCVCVYLCVCCVCVCMYMCVLEKNLIC